MVTLLEIYAIVFIVFIVLLIFQKKSKPIFVLFGHGEYINDNHFIVPNDLTLIFMCQLDKEWDVKKSKERLFWKHLQSTSSIEASAIDGSEYYKNATIYRDGDVCPDLQISMPKDKLRHGIYSVPIDKTLKYKFKKDNTKGCLFTLDGPLSESVNQLKKGVYIIVTCRSQTYNYDHYAVRAVESVHRTIRGNTYFRR